MRGSKVRSLFRSSFKDLADASLGRQWRLSRLCVREIYVGGSVIELAAVREERRRLNGRFWLPRVREQLPLREKG